MRIERVINHLYYYWDLATGECVQTLQGHTIRVTSAEFSPDGTKLVSASDDKTLWMWRVVR